MIVGGVLLSGLVPASLVVASASTPATTASSLPPAGRSNSAETAEFTARAVAKTVRAGARATKSIVIGYSVKKRPIVARLYGSASATRVVVIIGSMHGSELAGLKITKRLDAHGAPASTAMWVVPNLNPDGAAKGTRKNAHGVDLNRNGSYSWRPTASSADNYPGKKPLSEPETRAYLKFLTAVKPDLVLIYHQAGNAVDSYQQKNKGLTKGLAKRMKLKVKSFPCSDVCRGTLTGWFNHTFPGVALTVELPRPVSTTQAKRYTTAALWAMTYVPDRTA